MKRLQLSFLLTRIAFCVFAAEQFESQPNDPYYDGFNPKSAAPIRPVVEKRGPSCR